ncbi:MAG TPA: S41 family peptidase [Patescibacteria group bacterium]|nr:S41 family peptidase [Patescibacteria group bacterium]
MKPAILRTILFMLIAGIAGYFIGTNTVNFEWKTFNPQITVTSKEPPPSLSNIDMTQFWTVLEKLDQDYYNKSVIKPQDIVNGAISGMVSSLNDPFTMYLPPSDNSSFQQQISGQFGGIGAELLDVNKEVTIQSTLDDTPAQKAGLKSGDIIAKVDGKTVSGMDLQSVVNLIHGPKGTTVDLSILHKNANVLVDVPIVRDTINVKSVSSWVKAVKNIDGINTKADGLATHQNDKVVYIQLSQFGEQTNTEWSKIVNQISVQMLNDKSIKGVILDLRNNPGGLLTDAVYIGSEFISSGTIVEEEDGQGNITALPVNRKGLLTDVPLVVLINGGSASAAEIVSGALRDHKRAPLVGEQSFGKGTVQEADDLGGGAGLHVTVAKWLTPNGTWVGNGKDGTGLKPDFAVNLDPKAPTRDTQLEKAVEVLLK